MKHIEFVGPPGSGKSTIHKNVTRQEQYYGGTATDAYRRQFAEQIGGIPAKVLTTLPDPFQSRFEGAVLEHRFRHHAASEFMARYPEFVKLVGDAIEAAEHDSTTLSKRMLQMMGRYQLGDNTVRDHELLCIDEGITHRAVGFLQRGAEFDIDEYLYSGPTPSALVYVDAPVNICLNRQQERGSIVAGKPWHDSSEACQRTYHEFFEKVVNRQRSRTTVIKIQNTSSIDNAVSSVVSEIDDFSE